MLPSSPRYVPYFLLTGHLLHRFCRADRMILVSVFSCPSCLVVVRGLTLFPTLPPSTQTPQPAAAAAAGFHSSRAVLTNYHPTAQHKDEAGNSVKDAWDFTDGKPLFSLHGWCYCVVGIIAPSLSPSSSPTLIPLPNRELQARQHDPSALPG